MSQIYVKDNISHIDIKNTIINFFNLFFSHFYKMLLSIIFAVIVPKFLPVEEYGYLQLFLFYTSYIYILSFGWVNGIYLRYGGEDYNSINKKKIGSQLILYCFVQVSILILVIAFLYFFIDNSDKRYVISLTCIYGAFFSPIYFLSNLFQATNKIKEVSKMYLIERVIYSIGMIVLFILGEKDYKLWLTISIIAQVVEMLLALYYSRDLFKYRFSIDLGVIKESWNNINVGIKLMIANMSGMLIIGIVRWGIEYQWDVATFGKISLTITISNFLMTFISAIGVVIFPIIKKVPQEMFEKVYDTLKIFLMVISFSSLLAYYPIKVIVSAWLPEYSDGLRYMAILFPICIFESKSSMLITTYMKALRLEAWILITNVSSVILTMFVSIFTIGIFKNITLAVASIVFLQAFKCILSEIILAKFMNINMKKDIIAQCSLAIIFIIVSWNIESYISVVIYFIFYIVYLLFYKKDILNTLSVLKKYIGRK